MQGIYALVDPRSDQIRYIGRSTNMRRRYNEHIEKRETTKVGRWKQKLFDMGLKPVLRMLEVVEIRDTLKEREMYWIAYGRSQGWDLLNLTDGGDGTLNPSESHRQAIAEANKRRVFTDEQRAAVSARSKGRKHTPEVIEKCREAAQKPRGPLSEEHKAKISKAHKGKHYPKLSAALKGKPNTNKGKKMSDESRARTSLATKAAMQNPDIRAKISAAKRGKPSPKKGIPLSAEQKQKVSEGRRRYLAEKAKEREPES